MISSFRDKRLEAFWTRGKTKGIRPDWKRKVEKILWVLHEARSLEMLKHIMGFHPLTGDQDGRYAMSVSGNWRITFGWQEPYAIEIDLEDYH